MEHLSMHLGDEALVAGAIQFRWMYPIERYLLTLKQYVRNRAHPEGSMAKGYLVEECMNFCAQYLNDVETKLNWPVRNYNSAANMGRAVGETTTFNLGHTSYVQCHRYILFNTKAVEPFLKKHLEELRMKMPRADDHQLRNEHFRTFHTWLKEHVHTLRRTDNTIFSEEIQTLANGPHNEARRFTGYITNGFRFRVKSMDDRRASQNSGVALKADTISYASREDKNPRVGAVYYCGQVIDIIEIQYTNAMKYVLFKCDRIDNVRGKKEDNFKFTLINFNHLLYRDDQITNEPFILVSQAKQLWYVADPIESDWQVVVKMSQRGLFDMYSADLETEPYMSQQLEENIMVRDEEVGWVREVVEGETIDVEMREN
ncbi:uncharacterized protein LOC114292882 [Camellia sinensis]|uniref:uncharacterized protein LOC114292882 n=1 Tax=Camellia sinensis TaxID=4442 RepID=UPI0010367BA3|nr:uncharacterized protein LOC114292882 [Camellia sinensis]